MSPPRPELFLVPAYGRRYETEREALADWDAGKDFKLMSGPYCSQRDIAALRKMADLVVLLWQYPHPDHGVTVATAAEPQS